MKKTRPLSPFPSLPLPLSLPLLCFAVLLLAACTLLPEETAPGQLRYSAPTEKKIERGGFLPGTGVQYVAPTEDRGAEMRIDGQTAYKKVADSVDWSGSPLAGVKLDINQRVLFFNEEQMRLGGQVTLLIDDVNPQPLAGAPGSDITFAIPVSYNVDVGDTVPGTTLRLEGIDEERGAEFSGWSVEQLPYKKLADSVIWDGSLRPGVAISFQQMRLAFIGADSVRLAGIVDVILLP